MRVVVIFLVVFVVGGSPVPGARHKSNSELKANQEVRTIVSAIVDAILDGDRKRRSEVVDTDSNDDIEQKNEKSITKNNKDISSKEEKTPKRRNTKQLIFTKRDESADDSSESDDVELADVMATSVVNPGQDRTPKALLKRDAIDARKPNFAKQGSRQLKNKHTASKGAPQFQNDTDNKLKKSRGHENAVEEEFDTDKNKLMPQPASNGKDKLGIENQNKETAQNVTEDSKKDVKSPERVLKEKTTAKAGNNVKKVMFNESKNNKTNELSEKDHKNESGILLESTSDNVGLSQSFADDDNNINSNEDNFSSPESLTTEEGEKDGAYGGGPERTKNTFQGTDGGVPSGLNSNEDTFHAPEDAITNDGNDNLHTKSRELPEKINTTARWSQNMDEISKSQAGLSRSESEFTSSKDDDKDDRKDEQYETLVSNEDTVENEPESNTEINSERKTGLNWSEVESTTSKDQMKDEGKDRQYETLVNNVQNEPGRNLVKDTGDETASDEDSADQISSGSKNKQSAAPPNAPTVVGNNFDNFEQDDNANSEEDNNEQTTVTENEDPQNELDMNEEGTTDVEKQQITRDLTPDTEQYTNNVQNPKKAAIFENNNQRYNKDPVSPADITSHRAESGSLYSDGNGMSGTLSGHGGKARYNVYDNGYLGEDSASYAGQDKPGINGVNQYRYGINGAPLDTRESVLAKRNWIPNVLAQRSDIYREGPEVSTRAQAEDGRELVNPRVATGYNRNRDQNNQWGKRSATALDPSLQNPLKDDPLGGLLSDINEPWMKDFLTKTLEMAVNGNPDIKTPTTDNNTDSTNTDTREITADNNNNDADEESKETGEGRDRMPADATKTSDDDNDENSSPDDDDSTEESEQNGDNDDTKDDVKDKDTESRDKPEKITNSSSTPDDDKTDNEDKKDEETASDLGEVPLSVTFKDGKPLPSKSPSKSPSAKSPPPSPSNGVLFGIKLVPDEGPSLKQPFTKLIPAPAPAGIKIIGNQGPQPVFTPSKITSPTGPRLSGLGTSPPPPPPSHITQPGLTLSDLGLSPDTEPSKPPSIKSSKFVPAPLVPPPNITPPGLKLADLRLTPAKAPSNSPSLPPRFAPLLPIKTNTPPQTKLAESSFGALPPPPSTLLRPPPTLLLLPRPPPTTQGGKYPLPPPTSPKITISTKLAGSVESPSKTIPQKTNSPSMANVPVNLPSPFTNIPAPQLPPAKASPFNNQIPPTTTVQGSTPNNSSSLGIRPNTNNLAILPRNTPKANKQTTRGGNAAIVGSIAVKIGSELNPQEKPIELEPDILAEVNSVMDKGIEGQEKEFMSKDDLEELYEKKELREEIKEAIPLEKQRPSDIDNDIKQELDDLESYASALSDSTKLPHVRHDDVARKLATNLLDEVKVDDDRKAELLKNLMAFVTSAEIAAIRERLGEIKSELLHYASEVTDDPAKIRDEALRVLHDFIEHLPLPEGQKVEKHDELRESALLEEFVEEGERKVLRAKIKKALVVLVANNLL